jgi:hypothetical protein
MVRKGSTVRVRQRASHKYLRMASFLPWSSCWYPLGFGHRFKIQRFLWRNLTGSVGISSALETIDEMLGELVDQSEIYVVSGRVPPGAASRRASKQAGLVNAAVWSSFLDIELTA